MKISESKRNRYSGQLMVSSIFNLATNTRWGSHSRIEKLLHDYQGWTIWWQDGYSDETFLVNKKLDLVVRFSDVMGVYTVWIFPPSKLKECGWVKVW